MTISNQVLVRTYLPSTFKIYIVEGKIYKQAFLAYWMVYIYKKTIAGKPYYYLRTSERKGKRIVAKDIAYLGSSIEEVKKNIEKLSKYKDKLRKAHKTIHTFLESDYYLEKAKKLKLKKDLFLSEKLNEIESCKMHFNSIFQKHDELTKREIWKNFVIEFAFNTTSIEGNTIKLQEARSLLHDGLTPKDKTLREIYDVQNTEKVFFEILDSKEKISHDFIIKIHSHLMENIDMRKGYRTADVRVIRANFKATPFPYIKTDMDLLLKWYDQNKDTLHPLVLATVFHHKFEKVHPFMDGNGRTGRMLFNYILLKREYPPIVFYKKSRAEYLEKLREADKSDLTEIKKEDYAELVEFVAGEMIESYWNIFL